MKPLRIENRNLSVAGWHGCVPPVPEDGGTATVVARRAFSRASAGLSYRWLAVLLLGMTALTAIPAQAGQPVAGAIIGGGAGALIGQAIGGRDGAIAGAAIGAAAGAASASRTGVHGGSVQVGVGYAAAPVIVQPAPVYGSPYGAVYGAVPPLYGPVAPVIVAPPVQYRPALVYAPPAIVAPIVVSRPPAIVYSAPRVIHTRPPQAVYRGSNRMSHAGAVNSHRGSGHNGKRR